MWKYGSTKLSESLTLRLSVVSKVSINSLYRIHPVSQLVLWYGTSDWGLPNLRSTLGCTVCPTRNDRSRRPDYLRKCITRHSLDTFKDHGFYQGPYIKYQTTGHLRPQKGFGWDGYPKGKVNYHRCRKLRVQFLYLSKSCGEKESVGCLEKVFWNIEGGRLYIVS